MLLQNCTLATLVLEWNRIGPQGANKLAQALKVEFIIDGAVSESQSYCRLQAATPWLVNASITNIRLAECGLAESDELSIQDLPERTRLSLKQARANNSVCEVKQIE